MGQEKLGQTSVGKDRFGHGEGIGIGSMNNTTYD
jgi:hypothetical protein